MKLLFAGQLVKCLLSRLANRKLSVQIVGERQHTIGPYPMLESMAKPSYIYIYTYTYKHTRKTKLCNETSGLLMLHSCFHRLYT